MTALNNGILNGKRGIVCGMTNKRSIGYGIARAAANHGAKVGITYQGEPLLKKVTPIAEELGSPLLIECDVANQDSIDAAFEKVCKEWDGKIDFLVHSIAYADRTELQGKYVNTKRENFLQAMEISCYSFVALANQAAKLMSKGGSILTLSYYGAEKAIPNYNIMGVCKAALESSVKYLANDLGEDNIRVNALSAGPIKTLAAFGIENFNTLLKWNADQSPMHRNITLEEVGDSAIFLLSDLSSGITGEVMHVDAGYNTIGSLKRMKLPTM